MKQFVPSDFIPPKEQQFSEFVLRKPNVYQDAKADHEAIMASRDVIHRVRGTTPSGWPQETLTYEANFLDLAWHQREFEMKTSFLYLVYTKDNATYLGSVYIMPPDKPWLHTQDGYDVDVNMWVTKDAYENGLYTKLFHEVKQWIARAWSFQKVYYSNKEIQMD